MDHHRPISKQGIQALAVAHIVDAATPATILKGLATNEFRIRKKTCVDISTAMTFSVNSRNCDGSGK